MRTRPDAALQVIRMLIFGLGRVRAARGPHPFQKFRTNLRARYPLSSCGREKNDFQNGTMQNVTLNCNVCSTFCVQTK